MEDSGKTTVVTGWAAVARNEPNRETLAATEAAVTAPAVVASFGMIILLNVFVTVVPVEYKFVDVLTLN